QTGGCSSAAITGRSLVRLNWVDLLAGTGWGGMLSGASGWVDENDKLGRFVAGFGFAQADSLDALIVQLEILGQVIANNLCASFSEQAQFVGIALFVRAGDHAERKLIFLKIFSDLI